jgi:ABC-2 type transport system ATP-binding protein
MTNALELSHVCKRYPDFALRDVSFTLPAGCILGLAGENGAGKSTTINLIMDAAVRDSGSIRVLGTDNLSPAFRDTREDIGVVLDEPCFPTELTALQLGRVLGLTFRRWDDRCYRDTLRRFHLPEQKPFRDFSRGMRMKLAIAAALSHAPKLLILDEATSGLDPVVRDEILDLFFEFTRTEEHSILLSSHILSDLEKVCDYVAFLHEGRLLLCEEKDRLKEEYAVYSAGQEALAALPGEAVVGVRGGSYGGRALVRRSGVSPALQSALEPASIEDILLFMVKGQVH